MYSEKAVASTRISAEEGMENFPYPALGLHLNLPCVNIVKALSKANASRGSMASPLSPPLGKLLQNFNVLAWQSLCLHFSLCAQTALAFAHAFSFASHV